jgi:hypothetical protein
MLRHKEAELRRLPRAEPYAQTRGDRMWSTGTDIGFRSLKERRALLRAMSSAISAMP